MAQKNPLYYNVAPANVEAFNTTERKELGFVGGEDGKSGYIVTRGRKFGMATEDVENAIKATGEQTASTGKYISGVSLTSGSLAITETELPKTTVDQDKKSFTSDGTTYTLAINRDGQLSVSAFKELQIKTLTIPAATTSGIFSGSLEYDRSEPGIMVLTPSNKATFTLDLGTETIDTTNSYIKLFRLDDEGTGTYTYKTSITNALSQTISIPSTEQAFAPTISTPYALDKTTTIYISNPTKEQNVQLYIKTASGHEYDKVYKIDSTTIKSTATIKYRFKWSNQEINAGNFKNGTAGTDYQLYSGTSSDKPKSLLLSVGGHYYFAYPTSWGTPTLEYKGNTDTNWKLDSTTKFYPTEGVADSGIEYKIYKHQVEQEAVPMEWTITWA